MPRHTLDLTRATTWPGAVRAAVMLLLVLALSAPATAALAQAAPPADLGASGLALAPPGGLLVDERTTPAGPGMRLVRFDTLDARGFIRGQALDVDLGAQGVGAELLTAPVVADTDGVSSMVERQGAIAGVNGDFFDINRSGAALRAEVAGGVLRKGPVDLSGGYAAFGGPEGLGGLAQVALDGTVTTPDGTIALGGLNQSGLAAGAVGAFTPVWGTYPRAGAVGSATPVREVVVAGGRVTSVAAASTATPIPADGFVLLGREAGATALAGLEVGDAVGLTYAPRSSDGRTLDVAVGGNLVLVRDGEVVPGLDNAVANVAPRTAVGFADGGRRMLLVTVDGRQRDSRGMTYAELAALLERMGADEALNLDGGGSTTMVAREPGEGPAVRNQPSDGFERAVPNGLGVVGPAGSGRVAGLRVVGAPGDEWPERVFPGLTRSFGALGYDETIAPVGLPRPPFWRVDDRRVASVERDGTVTGRTPGTTSLSARVQRAAGEHELRVLGPLAQVTTSPGRISLGAATDRGRFSVIGLDADGYRARIEPADVELEYDESVLRIDAQEDGSYEVVPLQPGQSGALVTIRVGDRVGYLSATVGLEEVLVEDFEDLSRWSFSSARASGSLGPVAGEDGGQALGLTYDFTGAGQPSGTRAAYANANPRLPVPGAPLRLGLDVLGDGQNAWLRAVVVDAAGTSSTLTLAPTVSWTGWRYVETELPAGLQFPLELRQIYPVETNASRPYRGALAFDDLVIKVPSEVAVPEDAERRDPIVVQNGTLEDDRWTFAVMEDSQFVRPAAGQPENDDTRLARRAMREIVGAAPDFVVIAGDLIDNNAVTNMSFAAEVIAQELGGNVPVYYIPGNHEVLGDGRITNFAAQFGATRFTFDHEGTRFVLLNTAFGSLRSSEYAQLPELRAALDDAVTDPAVEHVVVLQHHPIRDPNPQAASQISDRREAALIETWLTEFREESGGKGAIHLSGHAHVADASRVDGVPYLALPPAGAKLYGPQDDGGFSGWSLFGVRSGRAGAPAPGEEWIRVEQRPLAEALEVTPPSAAAGETVDVDADGLLTRGRRFPLRYPATVRWEGSEGIVVASGADAAAAVASGTPVAVLDPATLELTGVRPGSGQLTVTAGSLTTTVPVTVHSGSLPRGARGR